MRSVAAAATGNSSASGLGIYGGSVQVLLGCGMRRWLVACWAVVKKYRRQKSQGRRAGGQPAPDKASSKTARQQADFLLEA